MAAGTSHAIRLQGVTTGADGAHGAHCAILRDVALDVRRGDILGIAGAGQAGKTALLRAMNGLDAPARGRVLVDGLDLASLPPRELQLLRRRVGFVAQEAHLLHNLTVAENVALPLRLHGLLNAPRRAQRVRDCLAALGLDALAGAHPAHLTRAQRRCVAVARALAPQPDILLCDEPVAGLGADAARAVLAALLDVHALQGITLVVASRDVAMLGTVCRRVAVLEDGMVTEQFDLADAVAPRRTALGRELACHRIDVLALLGKGALHA